MANYRKGACRGTRSGLRRGTLEWHKDPEILRRIAIQEGMRAEGWTGQALLDRLNPRLIEVGIEPIMLPTLYQDHKRSLELVKDEVGDAKAMHIASLTHIKREAMTAFHETPDRSLNRSAYLGVALRAEEATAKIDGSLAPAMTQVAVAITVEEAREEIARLHEGLRLRVVEGR